MTITKTYLPQNVTPFNFQLAVTSSAQQLADNKIQSIVYLKNSADSSNNISIGNSTSQNYTLSPGDSISLPVSNTNLLWVIGAVGGETLEVLGV